MKTASILATSVIILICGLILYIGNYENLDVARNETSASQFIRAVVKTNRELKDRTGAYAMSLNQLQLDEVQFERARGSYDFEYHQEGNSYELYGRPREFGKTGVRSFYVNNEEVIRYESGKPAGKTSPALSQK
jgi:hypothetical protein